MIGSQILSCFYMHFYTLLLCKTSAVIDGSDPLAEGDMSHIALLPCRKSIWLILTSSYLGYKANQEILITLRDWKLLT